MVDIMAKKQRQRTERAARIDLVKLCSYIALVLAAILIFIYNLLPLLKIEVSGPFFSALAFIRDVALLIGIGFGAYSFTRGQKKWVKILFWVALVLYIASVILGLF